MKIMFLGFGVANSVSYELARIFKERGHTVREISTMQYVMKFCLANLGDEPLEKYLKGAECTLKFLYKLYPKIDKFDVVFIEQAAYSFKNDIDTMLLYYHRDIPGGFFVPKCDAMLYRFRENKVVVSIRFRNIWYNIPYKFRFLNAVDPKLYKSDKRKRFKGLIWTGPYKPLKFYMDMDIIQYDYYERTKEIKDYIIKHKLATVFVGKKMPMEIYKHILERSEATLITPGRNAYLTKKLYEAALCKSLIVLYVQNDHAMDEYNKLGLHHGYNCLMFRTKNELRLLTIDMSYSNHKDSNDEIYPIKEMIETAYEWALYNHTYENRADHLFRIISFLNKKRAPQLTEDLKMKEVYDLNEVIS